jgi:hypothetical protein
MDGAKIPAIIKVRANVQDNIRKRGIRPFIVKRYCVLFSAKKFRILIPILMPKRVRIMIMSAHNILLVDMKLYTGANLSVGA